MPILQLRLALDQIGNSLLIPKWSLGTKVDEMINEIIVCIERLIEKVENKGIDRDDMKDKHILNLQRKVKSLKEQAEKKVRLKVLIEKIDNVFNIDVEIFHTG